MAALLSDGAFVESFIGENRKRLAATYAGLTAAADAAGIAYSPAAAAMFLWVDLRKELRAPEWREERALWQQLVDCGVVLTPGAPCSLVSPRRGCAAKRPLPVSHLFLPGSMLSAPTSMCVLYRAGLPSIGAGLLPCVLGSGTAACT